MPTQSYEDLIAGYYGGPPRRPRRPKPAAVTLSRDDGEVLAQPPAASPPPAAAPPAAPFEEYVVADVPAAPPPAPAPAPVPAPAPAPVPAAPAPLPPAPAPAPPPAAADIPEDDLAADIDAIVSGKKVYDPGVGMVDREPPAPAAPPPAPAPPPPVPPAPPAPPAGDKDIFERLAENMRYANAYDLGTVELENRFTEFDRMDELRERGNRRRRLGSRPAEEKVGAADFLEDIGALRSAAEESADAAVLRAAESMPRAYASSLADWTDDPDRDASCAPSALNIAVAAEPPLSRPLYDTGEHVQTGGDLYKDMLRLGPHPGEPFSYGQIIAMGDFFASPDDMIAADLPQLRKLKALIDRSTTYYKTNKTTPALDVSHAEWEDATNKRYLKLAEDNYDHFAPNTLFDDATAKAANRRPDHRSAWEMHHQRAIEEAQQLALLPENQDRTPFPEWPLIINAFGDHYLTDAFASGHLINKEVMIAYFRKNFFSGSSLTAAGKTFFKRVAAEAFVGEVRRKFSVLETVDYPVCAWGWCIKWRPNIDSTSTFEKLLVTAAETEPEKVANFAVKALHDKLNEDGIEVVNAAGDGPWKLTGDGYLNPTSLAIMRKAVQESIDHLTDPAILASNLNFGPFFERVWRYTPQPTAPARANLIKLVREYTDPNSTALSSAAATVIRKQVDQLIQVLLDEKKLKPA